MAKKAAKKTAKRAAARKASPESPALPGVVTTRVMKVGELVPADYNPRVDLRPGDAGYERLRRSMAAHGLARPPVWNERTGRLVSGHQRLKVLKAEGVAEVEVVVVDRDAASEKALNVLLNNRRVMGRDDDAKLIDLLEELAADPVADPLDGGWDDEALEAMLAADELGAAAEAEAETTEGRRPPRPPETAYDVLVYAEGGSREAAEALLAQLTSRGYAARAYGWKPSKGRGRRRRAARRSGASVADEAVEPTGVVSASYETAVVPIEKLERAAYNPRAVLEPGDAAWERLKASLEREGLVELPVWNRRTGRLVDGHQRVAVAASLGWSSVTVAVVELDEAQEKTLNLALSNPDVGGADDPEALSALLAELRAEDAAAARRTGFDDAELRVLSDLAALPMAEGVGGGSSATAAGNRTGGALGVVVRCAGESEQRGLYEHFRSRGHRVKPLTL